MGVMKKMKSFASVITITFLLLAIFCNDLASAEFKLGRKLSQVYGRPGGYSPPTYGGNDPPVYGGGTRPPVYGGGTRPPVYGGYSPPGHGGYRPPHSSSKP